MAATWTRACQYLTGDGGHVDSDGYLFVMGRTDDVINVSGHHLSTIDDPAILDEISQALASRP